MSNQDIAINWAISTVNIATGFVYSNQFFKPFSSEESGDKIIEKLLDNGVVLWPDQKQGAFIFKKNDPRLVLSFQEKCVGGAWLDGDNTMILPTIYS